MYGIYRNIACTIAHNWNKPEIFTEIELNN